MQKDDSKPTSFDSPASEPTEDEIAEALRIMGMEYGKELESTGQEIQKIEVRDASPGPRDIHSTEGDE